MLLQHSFVLMLRRILCLFFLVWGCAGAEEAEGPTYPMLINRGQIHIQFDDGARGAAHSDDPAIVLNGLGPFPVQDHLSLRRLRTFTSLRLNPDLEINSELNFDTRSNQVSLLDLYLRAQVAPEWNVRAGMFKVPFGWEGLRSSGSTNTIEVSDVTKAFSQFRDSGLAVGYEHGPWLAQLAVVQGQGGVWTDVDSAKDVLGRISYQLNPHLLVGGSFHLGSYDRLPVQQYGLELQYHEGPWKVEAEALTSRGWNNAAHGVSRANGYYAAVIHQLDEHNDVLIHFDRFEPNQDLRDLMEANNGTNARNRLVLGWNYYWKRKPAQRLMINYEIVSEEEGPRLSNNGFRIRYQFGW
jgi:hypothetical protein